jgi:hypothetical protein
MARKKRSGTHTKTQQKHYERVARLQYGPDIVNESVQLWNSYTKVKQEAILEEGGQIYGDLVTALKTGASPHSGEVQSTVQRWHEHLRYFYEPTLDILRGLGETYRTEPGFIAFFEKLHPDLPDYLSEAITQYVSDLESAEIERMLAEDDLKSKSARLSYQQKAS